MPFATSKGNAKRPVEEEVLLHQNKQRFGIFRLKIEDLAAEVRRDAHTQDRLAFSCSWQMDIFGTYIEPVHLVQAIVAIVLLWLYQALTLFRQDSLEEFSAAHSALLISFVATNIEGFYGDLRKHKVNKSSENEYVGKVEKWLNKLKSGSECQLQRTRPADHVLDRLSTLQGSPDPLEESPHVRTRRCSD